MYHDALVNLKVRFPRVEERDLKEALDLHEGHGGMVRFSRARCGRRRTNVGMSDPFTPPDPPRARCGSHPADAPKPPSPDALTSCERT